MKLLLPDVLATPGPGPLSPLEEGLRGADAGQACAQVRTRLEDLEQRTRAAIAAGVALDRYRELAALLDACLAAQEVLASVACALPAADARPPAGMRFVSGG
jgi:hypothetical protein